MEFEQPAPKVGWAPEVPDDRRPLDRAPLALPRTPAAAGLARRYVVRGLDGINPADVEIAELLTSELVANAVQHGGEPIVLQVWVDDHSVRVEVSDGLPQLTGPAPPNWDLDAEGGRGLLLMEGLTSAWGIRVEAHRAGKTVWFELPRN
jgi:anti-sigma regulatory factor (Ser/Thr protein kinase)